jgi:hypothetical protein
MPPLTGISIRLSWAETAPGWNATAWPTRPDDQAASPDEPRWQSGTTPSGASPLPVIRDAIEGISRTLNIHPDNTTITIHADGDGLLEACRRYTR